MFDSLRARLTVFYVALAIVPLLVLGITVGQMTFQILGEEATAFHGEIAENMANRIQAFVQDRIQELTFLDEVLRLGTRDREEQRSILANILFQRRVYQELSLLSSEGLEEIRLSRSKVYLEQKLQRRDDDHLFLFASTRSSSYVDDIRFDSDLREPLFTVAVPFTDRRAGRLTSVLMADVRFRPIWSFLDQVRRPVGGEVYVTDGSGRVVAHRNPSVVLSETVVPVSSEGSVAPGLLPKRSVVASREVVFGDERLIVVVEAPYSVIYRPAIRGVRTTLLITAVAVLVSMVLVVISARAIVGPIETLSRSARLISRGESHQAEVAVQRSWPRPGAEIIDLVRSFNTMLRSVAEREEDLHRAHSELEERVEDRTLELVEVNRRLETEIEHRAVAEQEREHLITQLASKNAELERFAYSVSHDLKSPLITIGGFVNYVGQAVREGDRQRAQEDLGRISDAAERMSGLLDGVLALSRIGRHAEMTDEVDLGSVVREAAESVAGRLEGDGASVKVAPEMPAVRGDRMLLRQVFENLIDNAVKYSGRQREPVVEIGPLPDGDLTTVYVKDNGSGIPPEDHERVFELFRRLDATVDGTGVGLATVKRIVEAHGGRVWVESDGAGKGSVFYLTLPHPSRVGDGNVT